MSISQSLAADRARTEAGWLFAASWRPMFLAAALYAAAAVPIWVFFFLTGVGEVGGMPAMTWHAHEMVFGYLPAVMAGYLLSATPNWTGRLPASGRPLMLLFAVWIAGRLVPLAAPPAVGALADAAFPLSVAFVLLREARVKAPKQSRHGLALFPVIAIASVAHRLFATDWETAAVFARLGVAVGALLIAAVGGRIVPSFTRNALAGRGAEKVPTPYGRFDVAVLMVASVGIFAWAAVPQSPATAALMALAGAMHLLRLARWRGWLVREGHVIALHAGYLWLTVGTILAALAAEPLSLVPADAALHAFTAGAIGTMTLAVMTRLALTRGVGRRARAGACSVALVLVNAGALLRVAAPVLAVHYEPLLIGGATLWSAAFALYVVAQLPFAEARRAPARA